MDLRDPRILAVAAAQHRLLEAEYDGYASTDASGAAFCRSAALIVSLPIPDLIAIYYLNWCINTTPLIPNFKSFWAFRYIAFTLYLDICYV
jgi:hypothetical protein